VKIRFEPTLSEIEELEMLTQNIEVDREKLEGDYAQEQLV
jgi:hypothetical protein